MNSKKTFLSRLIKIPLSFKGFILISLFFFIIYSLISLVGHYNFLTNAYDLGIFNQTLYHYAHFDIAPNTVRNVGNLLGDHFELLMFLYVPFYWIFGSYALLVIQILAIHFGALGIYLLLKRETKEKWMPLGGVLIFYLSFGIYQALAYDFHNHVVGVMFVPWLFYFLTERRWGYYYIFLSLFLVSKENMPLMAAFLGLSMLIFEKGKVKWHGLMTFLVSSIYFVVILKIIIPFLNQGDYSHWHYSHLGEGPVELLTWAISHPIQTLGMLFDHEEKRQTWNMILLSGGVLAIFKPKYSLLLIPVIGQKFLSQKANYWTPYFQYSIEFALIIPIAVVMIAYKLRRFKIHYILIVLFIFLNARLINQYRFHDYTYLSRLTERAYYFPNNQRALTIEAMALIPDNASVAAQNQLVPHLANRDKIYPFPLSEDGYEFSPQNGEDYVILNLNLDRIWPVESMEAFRELKAEFLDENPRYQVLFDQSDVYLYKKISDPS